MEFHADIVEPVIDLSMRSLCVRPYPGHPKGCPNHGSRDTCPPEQKVFGGVYDTDLNIFALWTEFDLGAHVSRMKKAHPTWSYRQLSCCLYWQGTVRKFLRTKSKKWIDFAVLHTPFADRILLTTCPEAMGINVTATMKNIGVQLEWPPKSLTRMVYLAGVLR